MNAIFYMLLLCLLLYILYTVFKTVVGGTPLSIKYITEQEKEIENIRNKKNKINLETLTYEELLEYEKKQRENLNRFDSTE